MILIIVCFDNLVTSALIPDPETQGLSTKAVKKAWPSLSIWQRRIYLSSARGARCVNKGDKQLVQKHIRQDLEWDIKHAWVSRKVYRPNNYSQHRPRQERQWEIPVAGWDYSTTDNDYLFQYFKSTANILQFQFQTVNVFFSPNLESTAT